MFKKKPRINVTFEESTSLLLTTLAQQENQSVAGLVRQLALEALEMREDFYLSKLAESFDQKAVSTYSHQEAWK